MVPSNFMFRFGTATLRPRQKPFIYKPDVYRSITFMSESKRNGIQSYNAHLPFDSMLCDIGPFAITIKPFKGNITLLGLCCSTYIASSSRMDVPLMISYTLTRTRIKRKIIYRRLTLNGDCSDASPK